MTWFGRRGGGYRGGRPASEVPPPPRIPSATIRPGVWRLNPPVEPRVLRQPEDTGGLDRVLAHALIEAWHDTTCPEGWQCRDRTLHMVSGVGPERAFALSNHPAVQRVLNHARGVGVARTGSGD